MPEMSIADRLTAVFDHLSINKPRSPPVCLQTGVVSSVRLRAAWQIWRWLRHTLIKGCRQKLEVLTNRWWLLPVMRARRPSVAGCWRGSFRIARSFL